jgi:hypothetical protein
MNGGAVGVFIAPTTKHDRWWRLSVVWCTGQSGVHRTCPVNYSGAAVLISRGCQVPEPRSFGAPDTVWCTPDNPVNYSAPALRIPEAEESSAESPGAPDRYCRMSGGALDMSGAPDQGTLRYSFSSPFGTQRWSF